jgi:hypothetical protein
MELGAHQRQGGLHRLGISEKGLVRQMLCR